MSTTDKGFKTKKIRACTNWGAGTDFYDKQPAKSGLMAGNYEKRKEWYI
jgi:hypothetical protein